MIVKEVLKTVDIIDTEITAIESKIQNIKKLSTTGSASAAGAITSF